MPCGCGPTIQPLAPALRLSSQWCHHPLGISPCPVRPPPAQISNPNPNQAAAMAIAARALRRLPLHLAPSIARPFCAVSPAHTIPSPGPRSAKVADRIVRLLAIDPDGGRREVVGLSGQTLLRALANAGLIEPASHRLEEIDACSAECEVHIAQEWLEKLPPPSYEEQYVLTRASRNRELNKHARLGCQVVLAPELQGMVVAVPEPKPWDIP